MARVMVVEDDTMMCNLLQTLLELENHTILIPGSNTSEEEFILQVISFSPDIILMDVNLVGINGMRLLQILRNYSNFDLIRIIMSSGNDRSEECLRAGADHFLLKPYMPQKLLQLIREG